MNPRLKRILIIAGFIGFIVLVAVLIATVLFRSPDVTPNVDPTTPGTLPGSTGSLPSATPGSPTVVPDGTGSQTPGVLQPSQFADGGVTLITQLTSSTIVSSNVTGNEISYYDPADGRFYTIDASGNVNALSTASFPSAETVVISDDAKAAAVEFPDGSNVIYDFTQESQITLPNHWEDFDFSPQSDEVVTKSIGVDPANRSLLTTSVDGSSTDVLLALGLNADKVTVNWSPNGRILGFSETGLAQIGFGRKQIFLIGSSGDEVGAIVTEGGNFEAKWSPEGNHVLYSVAYVANDSRPSLWYTNATGSVDTQRKKFSVETWVDKCTFYNSETIYCGVPREVPDQSGYDHNSVRSADDLYAIDLATGRETIIATPAIDVQMFDLFVSSDQSTLYFSDAGGRLNSIQLR